MWHYTSTHSNVFTMWYLNMLRDNFTWSLNYTGDNASSAS